MCLVKKYHFKVHSLKDLAQLLVLLAIMSSVANSRTLGTTTERTSQTTSAAFKDVLIYVLGAGPSERTSIITAENMQRRGVWVTV